MSEESQSNAYEELKSHLATMFQMDRGDLDFGIYRIMNIKRAEISKFLETRLSSEIRRILAEYRPLWLHDVEQELADAERNPTRFSPAYIESLNQRIKDNLDVNRVEAQIYSHLYNFFRRYYDEGDFMALRRYKDGVYALPYAGEEVKLHWANHDQYYIKTSEDFKHYSFTVGGEMVDAKQKVRFEIKAASTENGNNKEAKGKERRFMLADEDAIQVAGDQLTIYFEFRSDEAKRKQEKVNEDIIASLSARAEYREFRLYTVAPTPDKPERTLLEKHLALFTAKNSFDFFIHKDLGGFLRRELDFFIKNEIMQLDDIESESAPTVESYLAEIRALRKSGHEIIQFLAQLEEFQKNLWLKKKFVIDTQYCITLDHIIGMDRGAELLAVIAANDAQRQEWVNLFAIDAIGGGLGGDAYSVPLTVGFLKANDKLPVDTRFFPAGFKYDLLSQIEDIDAKTDGLLINSENFQALELLQARYREQVKCIYIDPPYNAKSSEILYKNSYKHSSWLSMMNDRMSLAKNNLTPDDGVMICAIDENEQYRLSLLFEHIFTDQSYERNCISIRHNTKGIQGGYISVNNEYALVASPNGHKGNEILIPQSEWEYYNFRNWGGESERNTAKNCFYPIFVKDSEIVGFGDVCPDDYHPNHNENQVDGTVAVYPVDKDGVERKWTFSRQSVEDIKYLLKVERLKNGNFEIKKCTDRKRFKTFWGKKEYVAGDYGSKVVNNMLGKKKFDFPKSVITVYDSIYMSSNQDSIILDYFAGSGTTGHAVINLNREDGGSRKYILVEMGNYFDTVTKPRVLKAAYADQWKGGKPTNRQTGVSQIIKTLTLESYEDTLNNLADTLTETRHEESQLFAENDEAYADFMLNYMLPMDSANAPPLLNINRFANPFGYRLDITRDDETKPVAVDLIESFNTLLGLRVKRIKHHYRGYDRDPIITVEGINPSDKKCLIIWRNTHTTDNDALDAWFQQTHLQGRPWAKAIFVNGDNNLENLKPEGQQWDVRLTEEEFKHRMFDTDNL